MKRFTSHAAWAILTLSLWSTAALAGPPPQDFYKEAQLKENISRDSEGAIQLYQTFLAQPDTARSLQANAYLHIGICQAKLGHSDAAKAAWKKIIRDYSDQPSYSDALSQLQNLQAAEQEATRSKTPVEKIVYAPPVSKWVLDLPRYSFNDTLDGKSELIDITAGGSLGFTYFFLPRVGLDFEVGSVGSQSVNHLEFTGPFTYRGTTITRDINYFMPFVRAETPFWGPFALYGKAGLGAYNFKFKAAVMNADGSQPPDPKMSKWTAGSYLEGGVILGWYRGLNFTLGYSFQALGQVTPSEDFRRQIPSNDRDQIPEIFQNHGLRLVGGPTIGLAFRW